MLAGIDRQQARKRSEALKVEDVLAIGRSGFDAEHERMNLGAPDRPSLGRSEVRRLECMQAPALGSLARFDRIAAAARERPLSRRLIA